MAFLQAGRELALAEQGTVTWYAFKISDTSAKAKAASSAGWLARPPPARRWGSTCPIRARACWRNDGTARAGRLSPCPPPSRPGHRSSRRGMPHLLGMHGRRWVHQRRPEGDPGRAVERQREQRPARGQPTGGAGQPTPRMSWRSASQAAARLGASPGISLALTASESLLHPHQRDVATPTSPVPSWVTPAEHGEPRN
jgi:hypothetical protein